MASKLPKNLAKKRANPGTRSKLAAKYLTPKQRQQRAMNARLNQPIASIPGTNLASPVTERDLAHEAQAATNVRYGPQESALGQQLGQAQQQVANANDWYNQYRSNLQNVYQPQVAAYQQGTIDAMKAFQGGITGLGQQDQQFVQGQQNQMPAGTAPVGASVLQNANAALGQRQALVGNFGTGLAGIGAANNTFASNLANVVAPAQQATAVAQKQGGVNKVLQARTDLQGQKGAYNQQYRSTRKADETKNLLAQGALNLNTQKAASDAATKTATLKINAAKVDAQIKAENHRHSVAVKNADTSAARLKEQERHNQAMEKLQQQKAAKAGKSGSSAGPDWKTSEQQSKGRSQVTTLKSLAQKAKTGQPFVAGHNAQAPLDRAGAAKKIQDAAEAPDDPILVTAALDAAYDGHLSPNTVKSLIAAGYKPSLIAKALGVPTAGQMPKGKLTKPTGLGKPPTAKLKHV